MLTSLAPCQLKKKYDIILSEQFNEIPARGKGLKHPSPATPTCGRPWEIKMNLAAHTKQNSGTNLCTNPSPTPQEKKEALLRFFLRGWGSVHRLFWYLLGVFLNFSTKIQQFVGLCLPPPLGCRWQIPASHLLGTKSPSLEHWTLI